MPEIRSVVLFGDAGGLPRLIEAVPRELVRALVRASVRPDASESIEALAERSGMPLLVQPRPDGLDWQSFVSAIRAAAPDLIVVDSYSMRLPAEILGAARLGGVNVHGALLPRHRGANPIQWALIDDDREAGVTIHRMTEGFDEGDVLAQASLPIRFTDTWVDVHTRMGSLTDALLASELPRILAGELAGTPQDEAKATYRPRRTAEDGRIDWTAPALSIYNLVRALVRPHPGAFHEAQGERLVLDDFVPIAEVAAMKFGEPGRQVSPVGPVAADGRDLMIGEARLTAIDWEARRGRLVGGSSEHERFARDEFGLDLS